MAEGNSPKAESSRNNSPVDVGPTPLVFNWGAQYMAEIPARVEATISIKKVELVHEYETHQVRPILASPFWTRCILLARDIQANLQLVHCIRAALIIIR